MNIAKRVQDVLEQFGLSTNEARVYQSALQLGETSPFGVSKASGIPRTTVYAVLTDLALKGLVELESATGLMKQQTKVRAKNPSTLREILWQKRADLVKQEVNILEVLPFLKKEYLQDTTNANFQFFPGAKGAAEVTFDLDHVDQDAFVFDYLTPMDVFGTEAINRGVEKAIKFQLHSKSTEYNLIPITPWTKHVLTYQVERDPRYLNHVEFRHLPFELKNMSVWLHIKGDRIRIVSVKGDEVWGLKIRSQNLAESLIGIHQALWKLATPITKDTIAAWGPNEYLQAEKKKPKTT